MFAGLSPGLAGEVGTAKGQGRPSQGRLLGRSFERGFGKNTGLGLFLAREILGITRIAIAETGVYGQGARFEMLVPEGGYRIDA